MVMTYAYLFFPNRTAELRLHNPALNQPDLQSTTSVMFHTIARDQTPVNMMLCLETNARVCQHAAMLPAGRQAP